VSFAIDKKSRHGFKYKMIFDFLINLKLVNNLLLVFTKGNNSRARSRIKYSPHIHIYSRYSFFMYTQANLSQSIDVVQALALKR